MDTKLKSQLYDIISLAENEDINNLVQIGNVKIREEDVEKYQEVQRKIDVIKPENQEVPITNFPGTDVPKPRYRKSDETDEEYVQFLQEYYSVYFENTKNQNVKKGTKKNKTSKKDLNPLSSLDGEVITKDSITKELENNTKAKVEEMPEETVINDSNENPDFEKVKIDNKDTIEISEAFDSENPLMDLDGEELIKGNLENENTTQAPENNLGNQNSTGTTSKNLEQSTTKTSNTLNESILENEDFDILDESEIISIKDIPMKLWEVIKSIPFIGKAMQFLENIITNSKKEEQEIIAQIEGSNLTKTEEKIDTNNNKTTNYQTPDNETRGDSKLSSEPDFRIKDNVDKLIINGVEPLTGAFSSATELFDKVENGTAYNYSDLEKTRIETLKDSVNPELNSFYISKIIKKNNDGSIEYVNSAKKDDLNSLIFEVSNKDIPDYVVARYSGKSVNESLKTNETIPSKAM